MNQFVKYHESGPTEICGVDNDRYSNGHGEEKHTYEEKFRTAPDS